MMICMFLRIFLFYIFFKIEELYIINWITMTRTAVSSLLGFINSVYTVISLPLEMEPVTTECKAEILPLVHIEDKRCQINQPW